MKTPALTAALWTATLAGLLVLGQLRGSWSSTWGDEGTYLAMAESLALDGDLLFDARDFGRLEEAVSPARATVILQRTSSGVTYSKPVLYAVFSAPFYRLFGEFGLVIFNALSLALALRLAWAYLCRLGSRAAASLTLVTFVGASVILPYVVWKMSDLVQAALALSGLVLCLASARGRLPESAGRWDRLLEARWAPWVGGLLLGWLVASRFPNLLVAGAPAAALAVSRRWRTALAVCGAVALGFLVASGLGLTLAGTANPYKSVRASFNRQTGYPAGASAETALQEFEQRPKTQSMTWRPNLQPRVSLYASGYFLIGRHTGLLVYFPALLALLFQALRRPDKLGIILLLAAVAIALFYLVWQPRNYFGGSSFLGNRYFLSAFPLVLVALSSLPRKRTLAVSWIAAAVVFGSAVTSVARVRGMPIDSQSHAHAGLLRWLPYESTAALVDGRRDRYWLGDFVRFVDPFAGVEEDSFDLSTASRPAELLLASPRPAAGVLFEVATEAADLELLVSDWRGTRRLPLELRAGGLRTVFEIEVAPAWRRHPFWWDPAQPFYARTLRLALRSAGGDPAHARLRYAGESRMLEGMFEPRVLRASLPRQAVAGSSSRLRLRLQNMSHYLWRRDGALAVLVGYRLVPETAGARPREGPRRRLVNDVPSGHVFQAWIDVDWPEEPGDYRLVVDLLAEGVGWFADRVGRPLAQASVEVTAPQEGL